MAGEVSTSSQSQHCLRPFPDLASYMRFYSLMNEARVLSQLHENTHPLPRIKMKGISDLLEADMEESAPFIDENSILSSASDATNVTTTKPAQAKKGKKRQRVTMPPKAKSKAQKAAPAQTKKAPPKQAAGVKRKAVEDHSDDEGFNDHVNETIENPVTEEPAPAPKSKKRGRPAAKSKAAAQVVEAQETEDDLVQVEEAPVIVRSNHAASKRNKQADKVTNKAPPPPKSKVPQQSRSIITDQHGEEADDTNPEVRIIALPKATTVARDNSRSRQDPPFRRRAGSASDTERGDPNLRRKLGDVTRKFENVDLKYRNLKEVGINEANTNMEKLRKQCDATMQASNDLITSLKKEIATQAPLAQEAYKLKKQMQNQEDEMGKMRETAAYLSGSLTTAQNEIKALQAKLAAARSSSVDHAKTPGSAIKSTAQRSIMMGNADAAKAAEVSQMKLDLYSDLTGLVVLNAKKSEEGDTYECIQTGQNGSKYSQMLINPSETDHDTALHFRLFIDLETARTMSFEETEYLYTPLLDADRDYEMMKLMPNYLAEEITFARLNASKFYGRVVDTLTKKRIEE